MASLNKVFLMGNLTRDPELRATPSGYSVASFGIAVNRKWRSKDGEDQNEICYVDVTAFGKTADVIGQYFQKGKPIFIEGRLKFSQWETKEGQKRSKLDVTMESFQFLGGDGRPSGDAAVAKTQEAFSGTVVDEADLPF